MRLRLTIALLATGALTTALPAFANPAAPAAAHVIPGYYDVKTGTFKPIVSQSAGSVPDAATVTRTGSFVVNFTITVKSAIATATPIYLEVSATASELSTPFALNFFEETATVQATRTSAGAAHGTVTIPYSWQHLVSPTKDAVNLTYTIAAGTSAAAPFNSERSSSQNIATLIGVPANGATTTEAVAATI